MHFRYKYEHFDCAYCTDLEGKPRCPHRHCPYILDNLDDLLRDCAFRNAVRHAEGWATYHRPVLLLIQRWGLECPA